MVKWHTNACKQFCNEMKALEIVFRSMIQKQSNHRLVWVLGITTSAPHQNEKQARTFDVEAEFIIKLSVTNNTHIQFCMYFKKLLVRRIYRMEVMKRAGIPTTIRIWSLPLSLHTFLHRSCVWVLNKIYIMKSPHLSTPILSLSTVTVIFRFDFRRVYCRLCIHRIITYWIHIQRLWRRDQSKILYRTWIIDMAGEWCSLSIFFLFFFFHFFSSHSFFVVRYYL